EEEYQEPEAEEEYQEPEVEEEYLEPEIEEVDSGNTEGADLSEDEITGLQYQLVSLGWLEADSFTPGTLDEATVYAIIEFQGYCNDNYGLGLPMIDPMNPIIDADTLDALKNADESYANPNAALALDDAPDSDDHIELDDYDESEAYDESEVYDESDEIEEYLEADEGEDM
ncbi:MAG: hypothetical protein IJH25_11130, partial [Clostridia bacterium]|nr:hypothetical protein [Clostridia bacterium]